MWTVVRSSWGSLMIRGVSVLKSLKSVIMVVNAAVEFCLHLHWCNIMLFILLNILPHFLLQNFFPMFVL